MKAISLIVIWTLFAQIVHGIHDKFIDVENYEGYQVLVVTPKNNEEMAFLADLQENPETGAYLDFWTDVGLNL